MEVEWAVRPEMTEEASSRRPILTIESSQDVVEVLARNRGRVRRADQQGPLKIMELSPRIAEAPQNAGTSCVKPDTKPMHETKIDSEATTDTHLTQKNGNEERGVISPLRLSPRIQQMPKIMRLVNEL